MVKPFIIWAAIVLQCPQTEIIDKVKTEWTEDDEAALKRATYVCANDPRYRFDTPCLITFIKKEERWYNAICGKKRDTR